MKRRSNESLDQTMSQLPSREKTSKQTKTQQQINQMGLDGIFFPSEM